MLQSIAVPRPSWVTHRRLTEVVATLVLLLTTLGGPVAVTDASRPPVPVVSAVASLDQAVGKVVRHLTVKAARHAVHPPAPHWSR